MPSWRKTYTRTAATADVGAAIEILASVERSVTTDVLDRHPLPNEYPAYYHALVRAIDVLRLAHDRLRTPAQNRQLPSPNAGRHMTTKDMTFNRIESKHDTTERI